MNAIIAGILCFLAIIARAFFYFRDQLDVMWIVDFSLLFLFIVLIVLRRQYIFAGIVAFLPSASVYLFVQGKPVSDLLLVLFLLAVCIVYHGGHLPGGPRERLVCYFLAFYLLLLGALLVSNILNVAADGVVQPVVPRYLNYLILALAASFLFLMVYREGDAPHVADAFLVGALAYMVAAALGYVYLERLDFPEYITDITKELFRYPGLSNSNYIGNLILLMIAIAYTLRKDRTYLYSIVVVLTAVLAQSRSVLFSGMVFLMYCAVNVGSKFRRSVGILSLSVIMITLLSAYFYEPSNERLPGIVQQYADRVSMRTGNDSIAERYDLARWALHRATDNLKHFLIGVGYVEDGQNPHNSLAQALLLFGIVPTLGFIVYCVYLCRRLPIVLFALLASLVEILFFTVSYDFLFFVLIAVNAHGGVRRQVPVAGCIPGTLLNPVTS